MLFVAVFKEHASLLIDAKNDADAKAKARDVAGVACAGVLPLQEGAFVCEILWSSDIDEPEDPAGLAGEDDEGDVLMLEPSDFTADIIAILDGADPDMLAAGIAPDDASETRARLGLPAVQSFCGSEAEADNGAVLKCAREWMHTGDHEARGASGELLTWGDDA